MRAYLSLYIFFSFRLKERFHVRMEGCVCYAHIHTEYAHAWKQEQFRRRIEVKMHSKEI